MSLKKIQIHGYAAMAKGALLQEYTYVDRLNTHAVLIQITHCGIGRGDLDFINNTWGENGYPLIPGHELVGIVKDVGSEVRNIVIGDRVGIGYQIASCMVCEECLSGNENLCAKQKVLCLNHFGGLADAIIIEEGFVIKIPDKLPSSEAASFMCSGVTVYAALKNYAVERGMKVGVVGIGGLGHLALIFLEVMGCKVTAFSHTPQKKEFFKQREAISFVSTDDNASFFEQKGEYDFILATTTADIDWSLYIKLLKPTGRICFVGLPVNKVALFIPLLADLAQKSICGSYIGNRKQTSELLQFAADNAVHPVIELFQIKEVNAALQKLKDGNIAFKGVIEMESS